MSAKAIVLVCCVFTLLILGMFIFAYLSAEEQVATSVKAFLGL